MILNYKMKSSPILLIYGQLTTEDGIFDTITGSHLRIVIEIIEKLSKHTHYIITWFKGDKSGPFPMIMDAKNFRLELPAHVKSEPIYYKYADSIKELAVLLPTVWCAFCGVTIYPVKNELWGTGYVQDKVNDRSYEKSLGMDYENKIWSRSKNQVIAVFGAIYEIFTFAFKLRYSKSFKKKLFNEFGRASWVSSAQDNGAIFEIGGHDEYVSFTFMTTNPDAVRIIEDICRNASIPIRSNKAE